MKHGGDDTIYAWRYWAHEVMDTTWRSGLMKRGQMYAMLRRELGTVIHVGECSVNECKQIIALFNPDLLKEYENIVARART